jgi:hypothetical protein
MGLRGFWETWPAAPQSTPPGVSTRHYHTNDATILDRQVASNLSVLETPLRQQDHARSQQEVADVRGAFHAQQIFNWAWPNRSKLGWKKQHLHEFFKQSNPSRGSFLSSWPSILHNT